jgi:EAL domain-containing protein (putative c-di-GMP-specific phosphodiesterase class I)
MAKEKGRNRIQLYSSKDTELAVRSVEMAWVQRLRSAMEEERFCLYSQDIIPLRHEGKKSGRHVEVLLRLRDEADNIILPGTFIPAAERFGLMPDIDRIVVRLAFETCGNVRSRAITPSRYVRSTCPALLCAMTISSTSSAGSLSAMPLRRG